MAEEFFHTYIVGGAREQTQSFIENFLKEQNVELKGNPDLTVNEYISFSVENSRDLKEWQSLAALGNRKVYVAYIDFITPQAENALLKTLEEPVAQTHIIFSVPKPETLLPTLLSRARVVYVGSDESESSEKEISKFLKMTIAERLSFVQKLAEKSDDEDASAEKRKKSLLFIESLEKFFAEDVLKNREKLDLILKLKKYLYTPGASVKSILETISFLV